MWNPGGRKAMKEPGGPQKERWAHKWILRPPISGTVLLLSPYSPSSSTPSWRPLCPQIQEACVPQRPQKSIFQDNSSPNRTTVRFTGWEGSCFPLSPESLTVSLIWTPRQIYPHFQDVEELHDHLDMANAHHFPLSHCLFVPSIFQSMWIQIQSIWTPATTVTFAVAALLLDMWTLRSVLRIGKREGMGELHIGSGPKRHGTSWRQWMLMTKYDVCHSHSLRKPSTVHQDMHDSHHCDAH